MKVNNGNSVQGLYNANVTTDDVVFTYGDIVYYKTTLYTCKGETSSKPNLTDENWEVYMGDKWRMLNSLQEIESADPSMVNYIGPEGLSQFIKSHLGGLNSDGKIQMLDDPELVELSSLTKNSVFQLSQDYVMSDYSEPLPVIAKPDCVYIVRTLGELQESPIFIQELIEYPSKGTYKSWVRHGTDLSMATWVATRGETFDSSHFEAMNKIVASYTRAKTSYDTLVRNIDKGNYYSFRLLNIAGPKSFVRFIPGTENEYLFGETIGPVRPGHTLEIILNPEYHYKIFIRKNTVDNNYESYSIDITPEDFLACYLPLSTIRYSPEAFIRKDNVGGFGWTLFVGVNLITRVLKAKHLIS